MDYTVIPWTTEDEMFTVIDGLHCHALEPTAAAQKETLTEEKLGLLEQTATEEKLALLEHTATENLSPFTGTPTVPVQFYVGKERQLVVAADKNNVAAISPVFEIKFCERWTSRNEKFYKMEIPDVDPLIFKVILSIMDTCNAKGKSSCKVHQLVTEKTVWSVLAAADQYQVHPVVVDCFRFLLHHHRCRNRSRHLCAVLEKAHQLFYQEQYADCLRRVTDRAKQVLKNSKALSELCYHCMLQLVKADDLRIKKDDEILVYDAVFSWSRRACAKRGNPKPGRKALRAEARDLIHYVRWPLIPRRTRNIILGADSTTCHCLVSEKEINIFLYGPEKVNYRERQPAKKA